jgi:D-alanyl-D-alanine carboxypeptidase
MKSTVYRNASGLPDAEQVTTARDQALLGRAIQERFPKYYRYFATPSFAFRGRSMRNHNKLLGRVEGVDGIKTGYTNASGFNLVTSMRRDGRHIVAAVFGGRTGNWRDARMKELVGKYIKVASVEKKDTVLASAKAATEPARLASAVPMPPTPPPQPASMQVAVQRPTAAAAVQAGPLPGSTEPIKPNAVRTVKVKPTSMQALGIAAMPAGEGQLMPPATTGNITTINTVKSADHALPPASAKPGVLGTLPAGAVEAHNSVPADTAPRATGGYLIQVGAFPDEADARARLAEARSKAANILSGADPFTEKVEKGEKTLYRARFAGFDKKGQAESACKLLKRGEIPCMLLKN